MIQLRKLSKDDGQLEFDYMLNLPENENGFHSGIEKEELLNLSTFKNWLIKRDNESLGIDIPDYYVPQTTYWVENNGEIIAMGKLRHRLNDYLEIDGGHIGYGGVAPHNRNLGIGTETLRLLLQEAKAIGLPSVLITPYEHNLASRRIVEKNGGVLTQIIENPWEAGIRCCHYWIDL